jgi:hypothetical protein
MDTSMPKLSVPEVGQMYHAGEPFVYANLGGFTCSVCAPKEMTEAEIEAFAHAKLGPPRGYSDNRWKAFD